MRVYVLFVLAVWIVTSVKLLKVWRVVPPLRSYRQAQNPGYQKLLEESDSSLKRWICLTLIGWGIYASYSVSDACYRLLGLKSVGQFIVLGVVEEFSVGLTLALLAVLFAFLVRWHVIKRIQRLGNS